MAQIQDGEASAPQRGVGPLQDRRRPQVAGAMLHLPQSSLILDERQQPQEAPDQGPRDQVQRRRPSRTQAQRVRAQ